MRWTGADNFRVRSSFPNRPPDRRIIAKTRMTARLSKSMFRQTLAPVVFVVILWVAMSSTTTYYVQWLERSHRTIFVEDVASIRSTESIRTLIWKVVADIPSDVQLMPQFQLAWKEADSAIESQRDRLAQFSLTDDEGRILTRLDEAIQQFRKFLNQVAAVPLDATALADRHGNMAEIRSQASALAKPVADAAGEVLQLNQKLIDRDASARQKIIRMVTVSRMSMLVIGPLLGMLLGWRLSRVLHQSIARIAVTLNDAHSSGNGDCETIAIESSGEVSDLQEQAEKVAERLRQVSRELQSARREVLQSERLAAVGELAVGVAHEIRNPLTSVKLLLQHAIRQASGPTLDETKLSLILEEIGRMESTIQGLLDFSRPPKLNRVQHDVRQTLQRAINLVEGRAQQQKIFIDNDIGEFPLFVDGDTEKLNQVFVNLIINAIEAMNDGGRLTIQSREFRKSFPADHDNWLKSRDEENELRMAQIVFRDTGPGIPPDLMPRLFEPFATSKERGTGLGLAVSYRIIEEHYGTIQAANIPGGGAEFIVTIPQTESAIPALVS